MNRETTAKAPSINPTAVPTLASEVNSSAFDPGSDVVLLLKLAASVFAKMVVVGPRVAAAEIDVAGRS